MKKIYEEPTVKVLDIADVVTDDLLEPPVSGSDGNL